MVHAVGTYRRSVSRQNHQAGNRADDCRGMVFFSGNREVSSKLGQPGSGFATRQTG